MKGVPIDEVLDHVGGYTCANDVGMHDFRHADRGAMLRVKGHDGFLPLGPELVPADQFDPTDYTLRTYLNGEVVQEATADDLIFPVAYQLADLCRLITLEPGDVILTGTPANSRPMRAGRRRRGRDLGTRPPDEHDRGVGRRPRRARGADRRSRRRRSTSRSRSPRTRPSGWPRRAVSRDPPPPARPRLPAGRRPDEASERWQLQFGLVERSRDGGRALLACNDEPYCLELVEGERPGHDHTAFELGVDCSLDDARAPPRGARRRLGGARGLALRRRPRRPAGAGDAVPRAGTEVDRWPQHARPSTTVHLGGAAQARSRQLPHGRHPGRLPLLHRGARDAASRTGSARRASGSTSAPTTT